MLFNVARVAMTPIRLVWLSVTGGFDGGLHANDGKRGKFLAQSMNGRRRGSVAGHHQQLNMVVLQQVARDEAGALHNVRLVALAIGRMAGVRQVDKIFIG